MGLICSVCACVCVCVRERECECVCVCAGIVGKVCNLFLSFGLGLLFDVAFQ